MWIKNKKKARRKMKVIHISTASTAKTISIILLLLMGITSCTTAIQINADLTPTQTAIPTDEDGYSGTVYEFPTQTPAPALKCATVTAAQSVYIREKSTEKSRVLSWLPAKKTVTLINDSGQWWNVQNGDVIGYVNSAYLERSAKCK